MKRALAGCLFLISASAALTPIADGDVFWHLAAGREMVRTSAVLTRDPFSISAAGRPWIDVHWLFQLAVYALEQAGGLGALVYAKALVVGLGALLLRAALPRGAGMLLVLVLGSALLCARHLLLVRPVIVTLVLLAFFFFQLERYRRSGRASGLLSLPLAQLLWSNCQGLFALGPALILAYGLGGVLAGTLRRRGFKWVAPEQPGRSTARVLGLTWLSCIAASLVTPYGLRALELPLRLLQRLLPGAHNPFIEVAENVPPFALEASSGEFWHLKWFLAALALAFAFSRRRVVCSHVLLLAALVALALISNRNVLLLYWLGSPIAALQLAPTLRAFAMRHRRARGMRLARCLPLAASFALLCLSATATAREPALHEPTPFRFPLHSAELLERTSSGGRIFCADSQGGYLIWRLYPRFVPYMDTRLILRTPQEFDAYLRLSRDPLQFEALQRREHFSYAILPVAYPDRYLGLVAHLYDHPEWKLIFSNGAEVLFARRQLPGDAAWDLRQSATIDRMLEQQKRQFASSVRVREAARLQAATLALTVSAPEQAQRILGGMQSRAARALLSRAWLATGDLERARQLGEQLLREDDTDIRSVCLMAAISMRRGRPRQAARWLRRAFSLDPFDAEASALRENLELADDP